MITVADLLRTLRERDPTRPRLTWYGPDGLERVELSGRVLDNWVSKAGNLLLDELDEPLAATVRVDLPGGHWRFWYWSLAVLAVGATLELARPGSGGRISPTGAGPDLVVSTDPTVAGAPLVLVTAPALARGYPADLPAGAIDEAGVLLTFPDALLVGDTPPPEAVAILGSATPDHHETTVTYRDLVPRLEPVSPLRLHLTAGVATVPGLRAAMAVWAAHGSVVVSPGAPADLETRIRGSEGVTTTPDNVAAAGISGRPAE